MVTWTLPSVSDPQPSLQPQGEAASSRGVRAYQRANPDGI